MVLVAGDRSVQCNAAYRPPNAKVSMWTISVYFAKLVLSVYHVDRNTVSTANVKFLESITMVMFWSEFNINMDKSDL